jgi:protocatechuate 3,4-dioxygenase beta subunit
MMARHAVRRGLGLASVLVVVGALPVAAAPPVNGSLTGKVLRQVDGTGIPGASVLVQAANDGHPLITGTTDASGTYSFPNLLPAKYDITVLAAGYRTPAPGYTSAFVSSQAPNAVVAPDLVLAQSATITGTVYDPAGSPMVGATVYALDGDLAAQLFKRPMEQMTDSAYFTKWHQLWTVLAGDFKVAAPGAAITAADGSYTIDGLAPGSYLVRTIKPGHRAPADAHVTTDSNAPGTVNFTYPAGATLAGKFTKLDGTPLAGVQVIADYPWPYDSYGFPSSNVATTDANGNYTISGVTPGSHELWPSPYGHVFAEYTSVKVPSASSVVTTNFSELGSDTISGTLTDQYGAPVADAGISFSGPDEAGAITDAAGHYAIEGLRDGSYSSYLAPNNYLSLQDFPGATLSASAPNATVDVPLTRGTTVSGKVLSPDGAPVFGAEVRAKPTDPNVYTSGYDFTGPDGSYQLTGLDASIYTVTAEAPDYAAAAQPNEFTVSTPRNDTTHDIYLQPLSAATVPGPPDVVANPGFENIDVSWLTFNTSDGGNPVYRTTATVGPGPVTCAPYDLEECVATGLKDDTAYVVKVVSYNQVGPSKTVTKVVRTKPTAPVTNIKVKSVKGGKAVITFKAPRSTGVIVDFALHYLSGGKWKVYKHKASTKPTLTVAGLGAKKSFKAFIVPVLKHGRASNSAYFALKTG